MPLSLDINLNLSIDQFYLQSDSSRKIFTSAIKIETS